MNIDENTTKIIIAVLAIVAALVGGAIFSIKKTRKSSSKNSFSNIKITGDKSKIVGGDDNSKNR